MTRAARPHRSSARPRNPSSLPSRVLPAVCPIVCPLGPFPRRGPRPCLPGRRHSRSAREGLENGSKALEKYSTTPRALRIVPPEGPPAGAPSSPRFERARRRAATAPPGLWASRRCDARAHHPRGGWLLPALEPGRWAAPRGIEPRRSLDPRARYRPRPPVWSRRALRAGSPRVLRDPPARRPGGQRRAAPPQRRDIGRSPAIPAIRRAHGRPVQGLGAAQERPRGFVPHGRGTLGQGRFVIRTIPDGPTAQSIPREEAIPVNAARAPRGCCMG